MPSCGNSQDADEIGWKVKNRMVPGNCDDLGSSGSGRRFGEFEQGKTVRACWETSGRRFGEFEKGTTIVCVCMCHRSSFSRHLFKRSLTDSQVYSVRFG
jgi:hypothetical protein